MQGARDLLLLLLLLAAPVLAAQALRRPPVLGPPEPVARCDVPVEVAGAGVGCLSVEEAARARLHAGDRLRVGAGGLERGRMAPERLAEWSAPIDLNRASEAELASLDGIGPRLAERIARARPFSSVEQVARVSGVGPRRLERLRSRLTISKEGLDE